MWPVLFIVKRLNTTFPCQPSYVLSYFLSYIWLLTLNMVKTSNKEVILMNQPRVQVQRSGCEQKQIHTRCLNLMPIKEVALKQLTLDSRWMRGLTEINKIRISCLSYGWKWSYVWVQEWKQGAGNILILVLYFQQTLFRYSVLGHVIQTTVLFSLDWLHSRHRAPHTYWHNPALMQLFLEPFHGNQTDANTYTSPPCPNLPLSLVLNRQLWGCCLPGA